MRQSQILQSFLCLCFYTKRAFQGTKIVGWLACKNFMLI